MTHSTYIYNLALHNTKYMQIPFELWYKRLIDYCRL